VATVMPDNQDSDRVVVNQPKDDGEWKTVHETAANAVLDYGVSGRINTNTLNGGIDLGSKLVTETVALLIVKSNGLVEIGYGKRMVLKPHSVAPPVRRKNSA
jgi:hypothetical protein